MNVLDHNFYIKGGELQLELYDTSKSLSKRLKDADVAFFSSSVHHSTHQQNIVIQWLTSLVKEKSVSLLFVAMCNAE